MAAREISVYSGFFDQVGPDSDVLLALPIVHPGRRAVQIYKVEMELDTAVLYTVVTSWASRLIFEIGNDPLVADESSLVIVSKSFHHQGALGDGSFQIDWLAPPGLVAVRNYMKMTLQTFGTGLANSCKYRVYYKPKEINDVTAVQLHLGA